MNLRLSVGTDSRVNYLLVLIWRDPFFGMAKRGCVSKLRWGVMFGRYRLAKCKQLIEEYFETADRVDWERRRSAFATRRRWRYAAPQTSSQNDRRCSNSGTTSKGVAGALTVSPTWSRRSSAELPRNLDPSRMCTIRSGSNPINRAQVASAATGSSASTIFPMGRGVPLSGPFPSIATMPSAITKWIGTVAHRSRMLSWMPFQCRIFFGHLLASDLQNE